MRRASLLVVCLFLASACKGKTTLRDVCDRIANAACDKQQECDPPSPDNCVSSAVNICCGVFSDCDAEVEGEGIDDQLDECVSDYENLSCTAFANGEIPQSCE